MAVKDSGVDFLRRKGALHIGCAKACLTPINARSGYSEDNYLTEL